MSTVHSSYSRDIILGIVYNYHGNYYAAVDDDRGMDDDTMIRSNCGVWM